MINKKILATLLAAALSGCAVTPSELSSERVAMTAKGDLETLSAERSLVAPVSLEDAIARALLKNRDKKLKALEAALSQGQLELVEYEMLPSLTASAGYSKRSEFAASASVSFTDGEPDALGPNPSYSVSQDKERTTHDVVFTWNILDFGLSYVRAQQHADRYLITRERERKVVHNITQDVRAAYWRAVSAERLLAKIFPLMTHAEAALRDSRQVESLALRSPLEALYYQRQLLDILRSLQALRKDLVGAKTELAALMGLKPGTSFELADVRSPLFNMPKLSVDLEQMEELALMQRPELLETHYQKRISAVETKAAILGMLPGINFTAGAYKDSNDYLLHQDWTSVGAHISWNLFDVFKIGSEKRLAKTREALADERRLAASMAVLTQVHLARKRFEQARKSFTLADEYLGIAKRISKQTENSARAKRASQLDLIRESLNSVLAELRRDVAYAELQNSYGRVYVTMGMDLLPESYADNSIDELSQKVASRFEQWQSGQLQLKTPELQNVDGKTAVDTEESRQGS